MKLIQISVQVLKLFYEIASQLFTIFRRQGKGSKFESKNYRPVAILPILIKVLERAMFLQLIKCMDNNSFFNPNPHAYWSFHSITTAMLHVAGWTAWNKGTWQGCALWTWVLPWMWLTQKVFWKSWNFMAWTKTLYSGHGATLLIGDRGSI